MQSDIERPGHKAVITILASSDGPIVKRFSFKNNEIRVQPAAQISRGHARSVYIDGPMHLAGLLDGLAPNEAIALGRLPEVGRRFSLSSESDRRDGEISRTKQFLSWSDGPSWALLDIDTKGLPADVLEKIAGRALDKVVLDVVPELASVPRVIRASSSAGIQTPDGEIRPASGLHVFILVSNGHEVSKIIKAIHDRLWAAGLGYFYVSKSGNMLERSLVDVSVASRERLIFVAPPMVMPPLTRDPPPPRIFSDGLPLAYVNPPNPELVAQLKAAAREAIEPTARAQKKRYEDEQIDRVSTTLKISKTEARKIVKRRSATNVLFDDDLLETGRGRFERVGTFLDRVSGPVGIPCPLEGSEYSTSAAYFYPADAHSPVPRIVSFAHGQMTTFRFHRFRKLQGLQWIKTQ